MGADEADRNQCEGSLRPPTQQIGRSGTCDTCKARVEMCSDGMGNAVVMPHPKGEK